MKEFFGVFRLALTILVLPLMATAAVTTHQYFTDSEPVLSGTVPVKMAPKSVMAGTFRNHSIAIDQDGIVKGRVGTAAAGAEFSGLSNVKVFFIRDGQIAYQGYSAEDGSFQAVGLQPGAYSFVASGAKGFAAFGVRLNENDSELPATNNLIEVATISPDFDHIVSILGRNLPEAVLNEVKAGDSLAVPAPGSNRVVINNGRIVGNLFSLVNHEGVDSDTTVHLIRDKKVVEKVNADPSGSFAFENVEPGVYEFVSKSEHGIAALSFEAVNQEPSVQVQEKVIETIEPAPITAQADYATPTLDVTPTVPSDSTVVNEQFAHACDACSMTSAPIDSTFVGSEVGCGVAAGACCGSTGDWGNYGGCGGGCGGGFGGLGGLAGLGRLAILGWILTELFDEIDFDDDGNGGPVSPADPD